MSHGSGVANRITFIVSSFTESALFYLLPLALRIIYDNNSVFGLKVKKCTVVGEIVSNEA